MGIGNQQHAAQAQEFYLGEPLPYEGEWRRIGSGSTRTVYLHIPTNVVYKVGSADCNLGEARFMRKWRNHPDTLQSCFRFPNASIFRVKDRRMHWAGKPLSFRDYVLAMEYIDGKPTDCDYTVCNCGAEDANRPCYSRLHNMVWELFGLTDMFGANLFHGPDDRFYIIDAGEVG